MKTVAERFWSKVEKTDTCWLWSAAMDRDGYGRFAPHQGRCAAAHRCAYELAIGPIPDGLQIDHLCRVRNCVNPAHLEPVTIAVNQQRGAVGRGVRRPPPTPKPRRSSTHCFRGHELTEGLEYCRTCKNAAKRARYARSKSLTSQEQR